MMTFLLVFFGAYLLLSIFVLVASIWYDLGEWYFGGLFGSAIVLFLTFPGFADRIAAGCFTACWSDHAATQNDGLAALTLIFVGADLVEFLMALRDAK